MLRKRLGLLLDSLWLWRSLDNLLRLVDTLNIPGDAILHPQIQHIDSEDQQLLRQFMCLNNRDKDVIRAAIQVMLNNK